MDESRQRLQTKTLWRVGGLALVVIVVAALWASADPPSNDPVPAEASLDVANPGEVYDPVRAGEPLPQGYRQLLGRDQIAPVYDPAFVAADEIDWPEDTLVIGVTGTEVAKAYPVSHLNRREMVIDDIEGIPILVSW